MILCEGTAGNSLHIGKAHSHKISEKNCSEAGPQHSCPANNSKPALPRAFYLLCYLSQLLAGIFDVCLRFVGARRRAPMPSHRCRHTASSSVPPLRLSKMQGAPLLLVSPLCSETIAVSLIFARRFLFAAAQANLKPALPRAFYLLCYLSQLLAGIFDVCLCCRLFGEAASATCHPAITCGDF